MQSYLQVVLAFAVATAMLLASHGVPGTPEPHHMAPCTCIAPKPPPPPPSPCKCIRPKPARAPLGVSFDE